MARIVETLTLEDKLTSTMTQCIQIAQRMANVMDDVRYSTMNMETATAATAQSMQDMASRMSQTNTQGSSLLTTVRNLAGAFLGMQLVQWLVGTSDQLTQIDARLQMMTGSAEAAAEANEQIYQAAMRARGSYTDMADLASKLGTLAGDAFSDTGEIVAFAEQLQKQMALSGTSTQAAQAAMLQLTQGLSSGTLRGEELNSVLEQTPMIAQTIADYMGVTTGEMRELASEGAVTADVVKNAILGAAEETNAAFEQMPMTWGQVWTMAQNIAVRALDPVLQAISWLANNIEILTPIVLGLGGAFVVFQIAANWTKIAAASTTAYHAVVTLLSIGFGVLTGNTAAASAAVFTFNSALLASPITWVVMGVVLLVAALYAGVAAFNKITGASVSATGLIAGTFLALFSHIANGVIFGINMFAAFGNFVGNVFNDPVAAVKILFLDMATTVLGYISKVAHGIEDLINAIPGVEISITSGIDSLYNRVQGAATQAKSEAEWVEYFKPQEYIDLAGAFQTGYNAGANFNPFGGGSTTGDLSQYTAGVSPYDEIAGTLGDISGSVKSIDKTVSMSDEDIKALVDVAERRHVNNVNLTAQTPVITINGQNTGNTPADRQALADTIRDILIEQASSGSTRTTARAF